MHLPVELQANLIGYWPLDEASGTTAYDYGSGANNGTINSAPPVTKMPNGKRCLDLDGSADYIAVSDDDIYTFNTGGADDPFSVAFWANLDSIAAVQAVLNKWGATTAVQEWNVQINTTGGGVLFLVGTTSHYEYATEAADCPTDEWFFFVGTYDGSEQWEGMNLYRNGKPSATSGASFGTYTGMSNTTAPFEIGRRTYGPDRYVNGQLSDVMIFDKELTAEEILAIYRATYRR